MTPLYGPDSNLESMSCIQNWCSRITTCLPTMDTDAALTALPNATRRANRTLPSKLAVHECKGWSLITFVCSIKRWIYLLIYMLCYIKVHVSGNGNHTISVSYVRDKCRATAVYVCNTLPGSSAKPDPYRVQQGHIPMHAVFTYWYMTDHWSKPGQNYSLIQNSSCCTSDSPWNACWVNFSRSI